MTINCIKLQKYFYWVFLLCLFVSSQQVQSASTIQGTVTDAITSLPIAGALVEAIRGNSVRYSDTTEADGSYILSNVQPSNYTLVFSASGYQTRAVGVKPKNNQVTIVNIALTPNGGTISGMVTDALSSLPINGASIYVFQTGTFIASQTTNVFGTYTISDLAPGTYTILVIASGFQGQVKGAQVTSGMTITVNFALIQLPGAISGQITDALTSIPLQDAQIEVFLDSILVGFANSDINGNYTIPDLAPDNNYVVIVSRTDYENQSIGAEVIANTITTLDIALEPNPGTIAGKVIDANTSNPIPGATIFIFQNEILIKSSLTDINGNYEIDELSPGDYFVVAQANNYQDATSAASISPSSTTIVNFSLSPNPGTISGTIIDAATTNPIAGAHILVFSGSNLITFSVSDPNGTYVIPNLAPGTYFVLVRANGYRAAVSSEIVIAGTTTIANFALNSIPGTVTGQITNSCNGFPMPGALVVIREGSSVVGFTLSDRNGNYLINNLAPGDFQVSASKRNFLTNSATGTVMSNAATTVNLSLTPVALPPLRIWGTVIKNRFLTQTEKIHSISWSASPGFCVIGYEILRNGVLIAFVPSSGPLTYLDHNRNSRDVYAVRSVNSFGQVSSGISITLPFPCCGRSIN